MGKLSAAIALASLLAAGDQQNLKPFGEVDDFELLVGQTLGGASAYYLGAGGGLIAASAAGLLHVDFCFSADQNRCPKNDDTAQGLAAAALIFGTGAIASTTAIYLAEQAHGREAAFWLPLAAGTAASAATVAATYALFRSGVDAIYPGLVACLISSIVAEVLTIRLLRDDPLDPE